MNDRELRGVRKIIGLLVLAATTGACAPEETSGTETAKSDLLSNVPYFGGSVKAENLTAGDGTFFNNKYYFGYIQPNGQLGIIADSNLSNNGQSAVNENVGAATTGFGPALVVYNNVLYAYYLNSTNVWVTASSDGVSWSSPQVAIAKEVPFHSPPTAVVWENNVILLFFSDNNANIEMYLVRGAEVFAVNNCIGPGGNGGGCTSKLGTTARPAVTVWQGLLYVAWTDSQNGNQISLTSTPDLSSWSSIVHTNMLGIPGIRPLGGGPLQLVYRATSNSHIYKTTTSDGVNFQTPQEDTASTTNHAPIPFANFGLSSTWVFYVGVDNELFTVIE